MCKHEKKTQKWLSGDTESGSVYFIESWMRHGNLSMRIDTFISSTCEDCGEIVEVSGWGKNHPDFLDEKAKTFLTKQATKKVIEA